MMIYTFKTASFKDKLLEMNTKFFIFGKLKEDFDILSRQILEKKPDFVIGMAHTEKNSHFEAKAINQFNKNKKIVQEGERFLELHIPSNPIFEVSSQASDSFYNWTAYKVARLIQENDLKTKTIFAHVNENDIQSFFNSLTELE